MIHITAAFSNAVLVAVLPQVSDCAKKLDLPMPLPITSEQVSKFRPSPYVESMGGGLWLTNGYWFSYGFGYVQSFHSPHNWFSLQEIDDAPKYFGADNMTTNDAIALARNSLASLGYKPEVFGVNGKPSSMVGPYDTKTHDHIPFCRIAWQSAEGDTSSERANSHTVQFEIDMQQKQVVGMALSGTNFFRPNLGVGIKPEMESDFRKRSQIKMGINTNAPKSLNMKPVTVDTNSTILIIPK
ncbi:MAG TPA: hypothetical protein VG347_06320 [Verrucomicrobiae bacterium]|nr:hypothetical protein [Verrucomicrobiae bacterium]